MYAIVNQAVRGVQRKYSCLFVYMSARFPSAQPYSLATLDGFPPHGCRSCSDRVRTGVSDQRRVHCEGCRGASASVR